MKFIDINKSYGDIKVLTDFNLELIDNKINCIIGPSGCGKTTILNIVAELTEYQGKVEREQKGISYIFQNNRLLPNLNVQDNLEYVLSTIEKDKNERMKKIDKILDIVELAQRRKAYPHELSGGMQQRVSMARAFIYPSQILLMDEPFKGLDIALKKKLIAAFLKLWQQDNKTVIFVTHDVDEALLLADKIVLLSPNAEILLNVDIDIERDKRSLSHAKISALRNRIYQNF
ncbi:MAG: ABC transporter ATP-binding protein [Christensenellales bacterium]|jgi:NitT/TauT family transport system ATP-binding protein|nr:ABC transporter ATP-binding protein [Clostridiales bacterium]